MNKNYGIHWFRRDLRLNGNQALIENIKKMDGNTLGLFFVDSNFLRRDDFSNNRFAFFLETLSELQSEMRTLGGDLLVIDERPEVGFSSLVKYLKDMPPSLVSFSKDYEPYSRKRDKEIQKIFEINSITTVSKRDHIIIEPEEIKKKDQTYYQVFTPFLNKWNELIHTELFSERVKNQISFDFKFKLNWSKQLNDPRFPFTDSLNQIKKKNNSFVDISIPDAGHKHAVSALRLFKDKVDSYKKDRDMPSITGTSRLSHFLKNGSLTTAQIFEYLNLIQTNIVSHTGRTQYFKELVWREFYYSILWNRPEVESESFNPKYKNIKWKNNKIWFERWKEGKTGFPIVDAGMRELNTTGFMHNRVRMIVASFLTKDLLIDWRWGEKYFMKKLLDGDLASNNGGWQWAASTGCDAQPYFRIFNPWLQSKKFDPDGVYIKKYLIELKDVNPKLLHHPDCDFKKYKYPSPMVDHTKQRIEAIQLYK